MDKQMLKKRIDVAAKKVPAETVIKNGKIVDVFNQEIMEADIAIADGVFAGIGNYEGKKVIDAGGKYILPGFIDGHVHIESAMVTPDQFAKVVLPQGVTTVIADPHEIANVSGEEGIHFMIKSSENIPLNVYFGIPSCVPAAPFENNGATLHAKEILPFYDHSSVISLGEVMDYPSVKNTNDEMMDKLVDAQTAGMLIDGHAAGFDVDGLNVYMAAHIHSDHECTTAEEAKERLQRGMYVMLREGSASRDLKELLKAVNEKNARRCLFVTDDKHLDELMEEGSINHNVRVAIEHGISPITAIQMATLNAAECFGLNNKGAIAPGYDADFLLVNNLEELHITETYVNGMSVAKTGEVTYEQEHSVLIPDRLMNSIHIKNVTEKDLKIKLSESKSANVISIIPNSITTKLNVMAADVINGYFQSSAEKDMLKLAVVERHKATGNIGMGIIHGLGLQSGAIASTIAHDSHNIIAAGENDEDLLMAIRYVKDINGGVVVVKDGEILAALALPIAGLISDEPYRKVKNKLEALNVALEAIGFQEEFNPFITLSFMALPVIPEVKLTAKGLFDITALEHIPVSAE
ncbi:adenine deaminase [Virgibacillus oceani]